MSYAQPVYYQQPAPVVVQQQPVMVQQPAMMMQQNATAPPPSVFGQTDSVTINCPHCKAHAPTRTK